MGSELDAQATTFKRQPDQKAGAFSTATIMVLFVIVAFAFVTAVSWPGWVEFSLVFLSIPLGAVAGLRVGNRLDRTAEKRNAQHAQEVRAENEREFQRKLAEAKAKGEI